MIDRLRRLAAFLLLPWLAACGGTIDVQRAERPDRPIPKTTLIAHRDPVAIDLIIPRTQLATIASYDRGLEFNTHRCDDGGRFYMSEIFFEGRPVRRETDEVLAPETKALLLREAADTRKGPTAAITILTPRSVLDGEAYLCGYFGQTGPEFLIGRINLGPRSKDVALPPPTAAQIAARSNLDCAFVPRGADEVADVPRCANLDADGNIDLDPAQFERLTFEKDGLARVFARQWYVVRNDGHSAPIAAMDNAPEDFSEGFARSPSGSKMGFIDLQLNRFGLSDGAMPFSGGIAAVCDGCVQRSDGEHSWYEGGRWLCLNGKNEALFPFRPLKTSETPDSLCEPWRHKPTAPAGS